MSKVGHVRREIPEGALIRTRPQWQCGNVRYRYSIGSLDLTMTNLRNSKNNFRFVHGSSMTEKDIEKVEKMWAHKLIKEH